MFLNAKLTLMSAKNDNTLRICKSSLKEKYMETLIVTRKHDVAMVMK